MNLFAQGGHGRQGYSLEQVRKFLKTTKGKRDVVDDYFHNHLFFIAWKLNRQRGADSLLETDVYRLRKLVVRLHKNEDDELPNSK